MKKILFSGLMFLLLQSVFGSPLVFKTTKEVSTNESTEIAVFDASKYKQIRVRFVVKNNEKPVDVSFYAIEGEDEMLLFSNNGYSVIDTPPSKIRVKVKGKCNFTLYIWASQ